MEEHDHRWVQALSMQWESPETMSDGISMNWLDSETCSSPPLVLFSCLPLSVCIGFGRAGDENVRGVETELPDFDMEAFREESRRPLLEPML